MHTQSVAHSRFVCFPPVSIAMTDQEVLDQALSDAFNESDMFKVRDLLHAGANANHPVTITEDFATTKARIVHPGNLLAEFDGVEFPADLQASEEVSQDMVDMVNKLNNYQQGEYVPTSLVKNLAAIGIKEGFGFGVGDQVPPLAIAIAMEDIYLLEDLLVHGADVNAVLDTQIFDGLRINSHLCWSEDYRVRQMLIDHGAPITAFVPEGSTLSEFVYTTAVDWYSDLEVMEFIIHNTPDFGQLLREENEEGVTLFDRIQSNPRHSYQVMQLLTDIYERTAPVADEAVGIELYSQKV